jgi:beta-barrel assembly-enhancing protease
LREVVSERDEPDRFGLAYAHLRAQNAEAAVEVIDGLLKEYPERLNYLVASARALAGAGRFPDAIANLDRAERLYPGDSVIAYVRGELEFRHGSVEKARNVLNAYVVNNRRNPAAFELLARAAAASDRRIEAHQMQAEYLFLSGDIESAIEQLRLASKIKPITFIALTQIESRIRYFENELDLLRQLI